VHGKTYQFVKTLPICQADSIFGVFKNIIICLFVYLCEQTTRFLAAAAPHSGDWLLAFSISSCLCGLRFFDDAVHVAVALRLGCSVCVAHTCHCGSPVDTHGLYGLVCKQAPSMITRHYTVNDVVTRSVTTAGVQLVKEPCGLTRTDGRHLDGLRTKMIQHSYTVGLCRNRCAKAQFRTKGFVLIFYNFVWRNFARWVIFTGQLRNPWQMLVEPLGSVEPHLKITASTQGKNEILHVVKYVMLFVLFVSGPCQR